VIRVLRASERYETRQPGIVTRSCFASGAHYDPDNVAFGPLVAVDEHLLEPGAGFPQHAHRGVDLVTVVLSGTLRHADGSGARLLTRGTVQVQHAGGGLRHAETNASDTEPLRFVQMALLSEDERTGSRVAALPLVLGAATLEDVRGPLQLPAGRRHLHVLEREFAVGGSRLGPGDTVRADEPITLDGAGRVLMWSVKTAD
jgi:redox-sensitive bicupin YhaK (pirin superfamily)